MCSTLFFKRSDGGDYTAVRTSGPDDISVTLADKQNRKPSYWGNPMRRIKSWKRGSERRLSHLGSKLTHCI